MASQSNDICARRADGETKLSISVFDIKSQKMVGFFEPMVLLGSESQLRGGRFHAYDAAVRSHPVTIPMFGKKGYQGFINMVEWIADNAHGAWAFLLQVKGQWDCDITFYFDNAMDAMLFRLNIN